MAAQIAKHRDGVLRGWVAAAIRVLILAAAGISGYLLSISLSGGNAFGCGPGSSCDAVLQSRWAYVLGMPVSAFAVLLDMVILLATFSCGRRSTPRQRRGGWEILLPACVLVCGAALWFVALQALILHRICPWCMAAHIAGAAAAVLLLLQLPVRETVDRPDRDPSITRRKAIQLAAAALAAIALFGVAQVASAPKTYAVKNLTVASTNRVAAASDAATNQPPPVLDVFGGIVRLDLQQVPVWGSLRAPHKLISLFDYTCHHCELMHSRVLAVQQAFSNELAVVSLPMPLDSECNPSIRRTPAPHVNACLYARLGLAVWRARPEAMLPYDEWFFEVFRQTKAPPSLNDATNRAAQVVGGLGALEKALRDPWVDRQLKSSIAIYTTSYRQFGHGSMPQFIIGTNLVSGTLETAQLREVVAKNLTPAH